MLVGVISDTHGDVSATWAAVRMFQSVGVARLLHCGDIGSGEIVRLLADWPTAYVLGNTDRPADLAAAIETAGQTCHGQFGQVEWERRRIAFLHGDDSRRLDQTVRSGTWDLVCCGHTHVAATYRRGPTTVLNPGAVARTAEPTVALVSLPSLQITPLEL